MAAGSHPVGMKQSDLANALAGFLCDHACFSSRDGCARLLWNQRTVRAIERGFPEWREDSTCDERTSPSGRSSQVSLGGGVVSRSSACFTVSARLTPPAGQFRPRLLTPACDRCWSTRANCAGAWRWRITRCSSSAWSCSTTSARCAAKNFGGTRQTPAVSRLRTAPLQAARLPGLVPSLPRLAP